MYKVAYLLTFPHDELSTDTMGIESIFFFNYAFFLISFLAVVLYLPNSSSVAVTTDKQLHTSSVSMEDQEADNTALLGPDSGRNAHINDINSSSSGSSSKSKQKSIISLLYGSLSEFFKKYRQFFKAKSIRVLCLNVFLYVSMALQCTRYDSMALWLLYVLVC